MDDEYSACSLIRDLILDASTFTQQGKAHQLLQSYFRGYSLDTLRPLLTHEEALVRRAAIFVASELGDRSCDLLDCVVPLIRDNDLHIRWSAFEIVLLCSHGKHVEVFVNLLSGLNNDVKSIRLLVMRLIANATQDQLVASIEPCLALGIDGRLHQQGLETLVKGADLCPTEIVQLISNDKTLLRKYGAIASKRLIATYPQLIEAAASSEDSDVREFAQEFSK